MEREFIDWMKANPNIEREALRPPTEYLRAGFKPNMSPAAEHMNWLFAQFSQWVRFFADDRGWPYTAIVSTVRGIGVTHAELQDAINAANEGDMIFVRGFRKTLEAPISVTKAGLTIQFDGSSELRSGASPGTISAFSVEANKVRICDANFYGFLQCVKFKEGVTGGMLRGFRYEQCNSVAGQAGRNHVFVDSHFNLSNLA